MGTDIHWTLEVLKNGRWIGRRDTLDRSRNYTLFAELAGVRQRAPEVAVIHPRRGTPPDASGSHLDLLADYVNDDHSHSWATLEELQAYHSDSVQRLVARIGYDADFQTPGTVRLLYFFDN